MTRKVSQRKCKPGLNVWTLVKSYNKEIESLQLSNILQRTTAHHHVIAKCCGRRKKKIRSKHTMYKSLGRRRGWNAMTSDCSGNRLQKAYGWGESMTLSLCIKKKASKSPLIELITSRIWALRSHKCWWTARRRACGNGTTQQLFFCIRRRNERMSFVLIRIGFSEDWQGEYACICLNFQLCCGSQYNRLSMYILEIYNCPKKNMSRDICPKGLGCMVSFILRSSLTRNAVLPVVILMGRKSVCGYIHAYMPFPWCDRALF